MSPVTGTVNKDNISIMSPFTVPKSGISPSVCQKLSVNPVSQIVPGIQSKKGSCVLVNQVSQIVPGIQSEKGSYVLVTKLSHKLPETQSEKGSCVSGNQVCPEVPGTQSEKGSCARNTRIVNNSISNTRLLENRFRIFCRTVRTRLRVARSFAFLARTTNACRTSDRSLACRTSVARVLQRIRI